MQPRIATYLESCYLKLLNPSLESLTVSAKKSNSFNSEGIEVEIKPNVGKKPKEFPPVCGDASDFSDTLVSEELHVRNRLEWGTVKVLTKPEEFLSEEDLNAMFTAHGKPYSYFKYGTQHVLCDLNTFEIHLDSERLLEPELVAKFLWYRTQLLAKSLLKVPETSPEVYSIRREYVSFLLELCYEFTTEWNPDAKTKHL